jgi:hypothetical protein
MQRIGFAYIVAMLVVPGVRAEAPSVSHLFPLGGQRGTTLSIKASGKFPDWPVTVVTQTAGLTVTAGKDAGSFDVVLSPDASLGPADLRFIGKEGVSELKAFVIGTAKEQVEAEPNNEQSQANAVESVSNVVNGALEKGGDVDVYAITLTAGQTLVADIDSRDPFVTPLDATLQLVSENGFLLAEVDDAPDLDPRIVYVVPSTGKYFVRVFGFPADPNQSIGFTGGGNMVYRLTLTSSGLVTAAWPLAVAETTPTVRLLGPGLPADVTVGVPPTLGTIGSQFVGDSRFCGTALLNYVRHPVHLEAEAKSAPLAVPVTVCGSIAEPGERDELRFTAKKDQPLQIRIEARELGFPLDPKLTIRDAMGKVLATVDDQGASRDAQIRWTPPEDGNYVVEVRDLHAMGGEDFLYRCDIEVPVADFRLEMASDRYTMEVGKELEIPVTVARLEGYAEPIQITCQGLAEGITVAAVTSEAKGDTAGKVTLKLTASTAMAPTALQVIGTSGPEGAIERVAEIIIAGRPQPLNQVWLSALPVKEKK